MTLQLTLPPELDERLRRQAQHMGLSCDTLLLRLLDEHLPPADRRTAALAMLDLWSKEDDAMDELEAKRNEAILREIDEHRMSDRKLFSDLADETGK